MLVVTNGGTINSELEAPVKSNEAAAPSGERSGADILRTPAYLGLRLEPRVCEDLTCRKDWDAPQAGTLVVGDIEDGPVRERLGPLIPIAAGRGCFLRAARSSFLSRRREKVLPTGEEMWGSCNPFTDSLVTDMDPCRLACPIRSISADEQDSRR